MKKLKALLLSLVVAVPAAISAPQVQAKTVMSQQQTVKTASEQQLAANTDGTGAMIKRRCYVGKTGRKICIRKPS